MVFNYKNDRYCIDVETVFDEAGCDDYIDMIDVFGVIVHKFDDLPEFKNSIVMIVYNETEDSVGIEINIDYEDYIFIKDLDLTEDEKNIIAKKLIVEG